MTAHDSEAPTYNGQAASKSDADRIRSCLDYGSREAATSYLSATLDAAIWAPISRSETAGRIYVVEPGANRDDPMRTRDPGNPPVGRSPPFLVVG